MEQTAPKVIVYYPMCVHAKSLQSCPTLCDPVDCSLPESSVHGILQAIKVEWVAIFSPRGYSWLRYQIWISCTAGRFLYIWATREAPNCNITHQIAGLVIIKMLKVLGLTWNYDWLIALYNLVQMPSNYSGVKLEIRHTWYFCGSATLNTPRPNNEFWWC